MYFQNCNKSIVVQLNFLVSKGKKKIINIYGLPKMYKLAHGLSFIQ